MRFRNVGFHWIKPICLRVEYFFYVIEWCKIALYNRLNIFFTHTGGSYFYEVRRNFYEQIFAQLGNLQSTEGNDDC